MDIGARIIELRTQRGFTQNRLAEWAGVSQSHLRRVELGESDITIGHLSLICDALDITLATFFADESKTDSCVKCISKLSAKQQELLLEFLQSL